MGVDDELLKRMGNIPIPKFNDDTLLPPPPVVRAAPKPAPKPVVKRRPEPSEAKDLSVEIKRLTSAVNELLHVFSKAHEDIKTEPTAELGKKMDKLIEQNDEIGRTLLLLLELHRTHLPRIARQTRMSSELRLRRPPAQIFGKK